MKKIGVCCVYWRDPLVLTNVSFDFIAIQGKTLLAEHQSWGELYLHKDGVCILRTSIPCGLHGNMTPASDVLIIPVSLVERVVRLHKGKEVAL